MSDISTAALSESIWASGRHEDLVQRVARALRDQILSAEIAAGTRLPAEADLARRLQISRPTLREATRILSREGLLDVKHGVGTFVTRENRPMLGSLQLMHSLTDLIRSSGAESRTKDLKVDIVPAVADVAAALDVDQDTRLGRIYRVRLVDERPFVVATEYVLLPPAALEQVKTFTGGSLYEFLDEKFDLTISHSKVRMSAVAAEAVMARALGLKARAPLMLLREVHYAFDGRPCLYAVNYHNTDVVEFLSTRAGSMWPLTRREADVSMGARPRSDMVATG